MLPHQKWGVLRRDTFHYCDIQSILFRKKGLRQKNCYLLSKCFVFVKFTAVIFPAVSPRRGPTSMRPKKWRFGDGVGGRGGGGGMGPRISEVLSKDSLRSLALLTKIGADFDQEAEDLSISSRKSSIQSSDQGARPKQPLVVKEDLIRKVRIDLPSAVVLSIIKRYRRKSAYIWRRAGFIWCSIPQNNPS